MDARQKLTSNMKFTSTDTPIRLEERKYEQHSYILSCCMIAIGINVWRVFINVNLLHQTHYPTNTIVRTCTIVHSCKMDVHACRYKFVQSYVHVIRLTSGFEQGQTGKRRFQGRSAWWQHQHVPLPFRKTIFNKPVK